ncbi:hypothetical protein BDR07DRAFT_1491404 [Suillus spraguei]|nr:hypothetical protein BDR07DRAFT_1491404 [Suillus spraguei]
MLESLNRQLHASEGYARDMIVELCLTVPLRLTHLLPHLTHLMRPLALALRGTPELVSRGLRTLELCIDNLTPDFLDPTLNTVLRELMEALHSHLKPLPASHHHVHTTIRILGKLGGRNRRLLYKEPSLEYNPFSKAASVPLSFGGLMENVKLAPIINLAIRTLRKAAPAYRAQTYSLLETCTVTLLHDNSHGPDESAVFVKSLEAIFDAIHMPEVKDDADKFIPPLLSSYLEALPSALSRDDTEELHKGEELVTSILNYLVVMYSQNGATAQDLVPTLVQISVPSALTIHGEVELVRTLLHVLKDLPFDLPRDVTDVIEVLKRVLRVTYANLDAMADVPIIARAKLVHIIGIFFSELSNSNPVVRQAAQICVDVFVELASRLTSSTYRIGILARGHLCQGSLEIIELRAACIKLLTASMPMTDFFSNQHQTRQRVTGVYFKSLYSPSQEVKEVAHEGLRMVLTHQSRLPKELLQTGLRPILMNLADFKLLSVSGLEGLARLLELLINYFKVEIGHKLLDHFRIVADPQMLQASSKLPLAENEGAKLVRLANIFHLLPSAANIFLEHLVNSKLRCTFPAVVLSPSPLLPRYVRTLRSILQARLAPNLEREIASRTQALVEHCLRSGDRSLLLSGLLLFDDLADLQSSWLADNEYIIDVLFGIWRSEPLQPEQDEVMVPDAIHRQSSILSIFTKALERTPRVDLLFGIVAIYTRDIAMDLTRLTQFFYRHVALNEDLCYRRNVCLITLRGLPRPYLVKSLGDYSLCTLYYHVKPQPCQAGPHSGQLKHHSHHGKLFPTSSQPLY